MDSDATTGPLKKRLRRMSVSAQSPDMERLRRNLAAGGALKERNAEKAETKSAFESFRNTLFPNKKAPAPAIKPEVLPPPSIPSERENPEADQHVSLPSTTSISRFISDGESSRGVCTADIDDITRYAMMLERRNEIPAGFLSGKDINGRMRQILYDWLFQVQERFDLKHETLHLAMMMCDRCCIKMYMDKNRLQLLATACLFLAGKYEEVYLPNVTDFVYLSAESFSRKDLFKMENEAFKTLGFTLDIPTPIFFLRVYRYALKNSEDTHILSKMVLDMAMYDYSLAHKLPSIVAQCALYIAYYIRDLEFPQSVYSFLGTTEEDLRKEAAHFVGPLINFSTSKKNTSLHKRYARLKIERFDERLLNKLKLINVCH